MTDVETAPRPATAGRLPSIDALRGLIMVIMALDHVRDFIHRGAMTAQPTDLATTTPVLFFTRWITHFCAPIFMVTAGIGAYFYWRQGRTRPELSKFLLTRGLWLILLEVTVMRLAYNFTLSTQYPYLLIVLWVLGVCMVALAGLVWLPPPILAVVSVLIIVLHNLLDPFNAAALQSVGPLWNFLHQPGGFQLGGSVVIIAYPLIPWVAVMALGFCVGPIFELDSPLRRRRLITLGLVTTVAFVVLRGINGYGDQAPWAPQSSATFTALSFLNLSKYPPSLGFLLMTLGPAFLLMAWLDRVKLSATNPLVIFGRVPLFYFVVHFFAAHLAAGILAVSHYGSAAFSFIFTPIPTMGGPADLYPKGFGYDLWVAYAVWIAVVVALYPLCRWFARVKATKRSWWLSYL